MRPNKDLNTFSTQFAKSTMCSLMQKGKGLEQRVAHRVCHLTHKVYLRSILMEKKGSMFKLKLEGLKK